MKHTSLKNLVLSAMFLAVGIVLPFFIGQIPAIGKMLLPMHIPVLLCGLICGWQWGLGVGFVLPLLRSLLFGFPAMYPNAVGMAFELAVYGLVIGYLYAHSKWQCVKALYKCLIPAMIAGRLVWGAAMIVLMGLGGSAFTWQLFLGGALLNALPGIALQLILIPAVLLVADRDALLAVDYPLLLTFVMFFIFAGNASRIEVLHDLLSGWLAKSTLLVSTLSCQFISNVPSAILLSRFTDNYRELLLGVNIGGTGTLIASLASLITYSEFKLLRPGEGKKYLGLFTLLNAIFLVVLTAAAYWFFR